LTTRPASASRASVAGEEVAQRVGDRLGERDRHAVGQRGAQRVAESTGVLDRGEALLAGDRDADDALRALEFGDGGRRASRIGGPGVGVVAAARLAVGGDGDAVEGRPGRDLIDGERAEHPQRVGDALDPLESSLGVETLQLERGLLDDAGVEEFAEFDATEELAEHGAVDRERRGPTLGQRAVALVHERADVAEQERTGVGRRLIRRGLDDADRARLQLTREVVEGREVVDVLETLAERLEDDRERRVLLRDLEELRRALALLPERRAFLRRVVRQ
jgi:hypothetical protein